MYFVYVVYNMLKVRKMHCVSPGHRILLEIFSEYKMCRIRRYELFLLSTADTGEQFGRVCLFVYSCST